MANHSKPEITDNYVDVLSQVRGRFEDQAKGFDPANTSATNIPINSIRWTSASNKWQKWNGIGWGDLSNLYAINISGNAGTVTNGVYTIGGQTIGGTKTFSSTIQGSISGNSGTVTNGVYTVGNQTITGVKTFSDNAIVNGNLGLGTSNPTARLQVEQNQASFSYFDFYNTANGGGVVWRQIVRNIANSGTTSVDFAKIPGGGFLINNNDTHSSNYTAFGVGGVERVRIDSNGKLILSSANQGIQFADNTTQTTAYSSTGSGASGTWGISITGNAATANSATSASTSGSATSLTGTNTSNINTSAIGSGTANTNTFLRGDRTWQTIDTTPTTSGVLNAIASAAVGSVGTYAFLRGVQAEPGQTYNSGLHYTGGIVETISRPVPSGSVWRAMGFTSASDRGTLFLRIS
jgi:hypothetical protein